MPELPEVETIARDLHKLVVGHRIYGVISDSPKQVKPSLKKVQHDTRGAKIIKVERRAKIIIISLLSISDTSEKFLMIHLKMTGQLLVRKITDPKDPWQRAIIILSGDKEIRFADLRKFGWIKLIDNKKELDEILSDFGPEPLTSLDIKTFREILASTRRPVKVVLMDQKKIAGIGNIYAADALNLAKIDPHRPANKVNKEESRKLLAAIKKILRISIKYRGASEQNYVDAYGNKGTYQDHSLVYARSGKKCFNCGKIIKKTKLAGRGTYWCPYCQK